MLPVHINGREVSDNRRERQHSVQRFSTEVQGQVEQ